jgi:TonB family protein
MVSHRPTRSIEDEALGHGMHMADTRALFTQRFDAARTALTEGDDLAAAESLHSAIVVARSEPSLRRELASALFHLGKLSRKFGRAGEAEAESLITEALAISEALFGWEHAALAPLLNELSRLYVQRSQYALAEEVLERLLAIARGKSEENADVATALAGLAVVKRKLGDDASAEALYRDALRIREKVLEPSHMVTVVTLEQLSATCAARGNFAEALALLRRALATREVALGPGHATAQAARSRVAELELQVAVAADTAAAASAKAARGAMETPAWFKRVPDSPADTPSSNVPSPVDSKKLEFLGEPEPRVLRPVAPARERSMTPTVTAAVAAASLMASSLQTPSASQIVISPPESARPSEAATGRESGAPYQDVVLADVAYGEVARDDATLGDWRASIAPDQADSAEPARKKRTVLYASAGVAAVAAIALAALLTSRPRAGGGSDPVATETSAPQRTTSVVAPLATAPATGTASALAGAAAVVGATRADSLRSASAPPAPAAPVVQAEKRAPESAPPELRLPRVEVHIPVPSIPSVPNLDSIVRSTTEQQRASDTERTRVADRASLPSLVDDIAVTPTKLIGRVPEPRFPDKLLRAGRREGQVVVRFMVNPLGTVDVASMFVERSDDELFTDAVRDILPLFRFVPARTPAPESKAVAAWVSVPFRFTTKK